MKPGDAEIYVDGEYWGRADDLNGWWQSETIEAGPHSIVIKWHGSVLMERDVTIRPKEKMRIFYRPDER